MRASQSLRRPAELIEAGLAPAERRAALAAVAERYAVAITPAVAELIDTADPDDPIARQFIPDPAELMVRPEELADPIGDDVHSPVEGVVHRYPDRVLLKLVHVCPVYCRFCFRREMVGPRGRGTLSPRKLRSSARLHSRPRSHLGGHPHRRRSAGARGAPGARGHAPACGDRSCEDHSCTHARAGRGARAHHARTRACPRSQAQATYVVLHINHARELTQQARAACAQLVDAGIPLLSQTVLLKGVNDDAATLAELFRALVENRIKPYYLHHADLAPGTGHLRTTIADGQRLMRALRGTLSGLCAADLCARYSGRRRQSAGRPDLSETA